MNGVKATRIAAARGQIKPQLVFKNASVFDVFGGSFITCDVAVHDGVIVGLGSYQGVEEIDLTGLYLLPGLIDSHMHIESSYMSPARYAEAVMPHGVTSVIADPHEIANVCGEAGLKYMIESAKTVPLDIHYMLPSCVTATTFDNSGARFDGETTARLMSEYDFLGLGEMMDYASVLNCDPDTMLKLNSTRIIDGHAPALSKKELCGYVCGGIHTDHEALTAAEAAEKVRLGMYVLLREGTLSKNIRHLSAAVNSHNISRFAFCTDDKHIDDILQNGTIQDCIRSAVSSGMPIEYALKAATLNAAQCYQLQDVGAIAPGYKADLIICKDQTAQHIQAVYKSGQKVAADGTALFAAKASARQDVKNTTRIKPLAAGSLTAPFISGAPAIKTTPNSLITEKIYPESSDGLSYLAVIERHRATGNIGRAFVSGIGIRGGAVAQTIGHDSHNITVLGDNDDDMRLAVDALGSEGGIAVTSGGKVAATLVLPVAGLMSERPVAEIAYEYSQVVSALESISNNKAGELLMTLAFLSLLVIPEIRLSDQGLFDVADFKFI